MVLVGADFHALHATDAEVKKDGLLGPRVDGPLPIVTTRCDPNLPLVEELDRLFHRAAVLRVLEL